MIKKWKRGFINLLNYVNVFTPYRVKKWRLFPENMALLPDFDFRANYNPLARRGVKVERYSIILMSSKSQGI